MPPRPHPPNSQTESAPTAGTEARVEQPAELLPLIADGVRSLSAIATALGRIADHFVPPPTDVVGSSYVADRLDCSTTWVAQMARDGTIPAECIVTGTSEGSRWKFHRGPIDQWLSSSDRRPRRR